MAKKLTAKQRKARKRASYIKSEYKKNVEAIYFLQRFGVDIPTIKTPSKITKTSLKTIRKLYKQTRSKIDKYADDYVDVTTGEVFTTLPTKEEAVKLYREEQATSPTPFDPYGTYIDEIKNKINMLNPLRDSDKSVENFERNVLPKQQEVKANFIQAIDDAIAKYGQEKVAQTLAQNKYMERIGNLEEKYTYEIVEEITDGDDGLMVLMDATVDEALLDI